MSFSNEIKNIKKNSGSRATDSHPEEEASFNLNQSRRERRWYTSYIY